MPRRLVIFSSVLVLSRLAFAESPPLPSKQGGPAPSVAQVQRASRSAPLGEAKAHGPGLPLDVTRFAAVVSYPKVRQVHLVVLGRQGEGWQLLHRLMLPPSSPLPRGSRPAPELCPDESQKISAVLFVKDYDGDGKPEALVRHLFCWVVPAIGNVSVRRMFLVNLDGAPAVALNVELAYDALPTTMGKKTGRAEFKDLNADSHPDLLLSFTTELPQGDGSKKSRSEQRFLWNPRTDRYDETSSRSRSGRVTR